MKKEWKKILSLVLALAMVLSTCTFVFAEGEDALVDELPVDDLSAVASQQMVYDFAEFFVTNNTFTGDASKDYTETGLKEYMVGSSVWSVLSYWDGANQGRDDHGSLFRAGEASRAWSDTKNTTLTLANDATNSTERIPNMIYAYYPSYLATLDKATFYNHYDGTAGVVYGDGGVAFNKCWPYGGAIGYGFGNGTGYPNMSPYGRVQKAVVFTAPRAGFITPEVRIYTNDCTQTAYRIYKNKVVGGAEVWTNIYPAEGTGSAITASYALDEHEANGWTILGSGATEVQKNALIWVEEGEQIVLRIASHNGSNSSAPISLDTLKMTYVNEREFAFYPDTRKVDLRVDFLPADATYTPATTDLVATDIAGVFTVSKTYVDGTAIPVTIDTDVGSAVINVKLNSATYDVAEGFYTANTYASGATGAVKYPAVSQTPKFANDGSSTWTFGYFDYNHLTQFTLYDKLQRPSDRRAYEDTTATVNTAGTYSETAEPRAARVPVMTWIGNTNYIYKEGDEGKTYADIDPDGGYSISTMNATHGSIGYTFGAANYISAGYGSQISYAGNTMQPSVIFTAPIDGVINPVMQAGAAVANTVAYRMYKVDAATGAYTQIYPLATDTMIHLSTDWDGDYPVSDVVNNNWAYLPANNWLTQDKGLVRVNKGDKIYLRFTGKNGSEAYALNKLVMNYLGRFGEDDELLLAAPMADYEEEEKILVYPEDTYIDLSLEILNPEAKGTLEYIVSGNSDVLQETATSGIFGLTGKINSGSTPAIVTASYFSPGKSAANGDEPLFTTSIKVYVRAASEDYAVFDGTYDIFDLSEMTYEMDEAFVLPYYSNASERAIYGTINLGLTERWKNATVTFSNPAKFEYLGNGRIRALASHTWTEAGGAFKAEDANTTVPSYTGASTHPSRRDKMSMGNPVVMTVTAPDGGVKKFALWAFPTTVQGDLNAEGADSNAYKLTYASNVMSNAVVSVEVYDAAGNFTPTYSDPNTTRTYIPHADHRYTKTHSIPSIDNTGRLYIPMNRGANWNAQTSNRVWPGWIGVAQTFTAPKDGTINLTNYYPADGAFYNARVSGKMASTGKYVNLSVGLYDTDGTLISTVWSQKYGTTDANATAWGRLDTPVVDTDYATVANDAAETLTINVKKGQKLRVMADTELDDYNNYISFGDSYAIKPVWTYDLTPADTMGDTIVATPAVGDTTLTGDNVLALIYNEAGKLVQTAKGNDVTIENGKVSVTVTDSTAAYAKLFFFDTLENIRPLASDIVVRK